MNNTFYLLGEILMKSLPLILGSKDIEKATIEYKCQARSLQSNLHRIAASALNHYFEHGDHTLCSRLIEAMPKSQRAKKLTHWFCVNGGLEFENNKFVKRQKYDILERELKLQAAIATPFWKMKDKIDEDASYSFEGLNNRIIGMIKSAQKRASSHGDVLDLDAIVKAVA